jgi:peptidoglycan/LPS O-acetylase OafA/YrhL
MALTHPSYLAAWKNWHGTLLYWAVVLICVFINTLVAKWLPKFEGIVLVLHILGFFGVIIPLVVLAEHTNSAFVFKTFLYDGGWSSRGISFSIGLLGNVFAFMGRHPAFDTVFQPIKP